MSEEHSVLSPSGAKRWRNCPASMWQEKGMPNTENTAAALGTLAHAVGAKMLLEQLDAVPEFIMLPKFDDLLGCEVIEKVTVPEEIKANVKEYVMNVRRLTEGFEHFEVETQLDLAEVFGVAGQFGTSDVVAADTIMGELQVHDYKNGYVEVDADDNDQMLCYASGALKVIEKKYGTGCISQIRMFIHQPNNGGLKTDSISIDQLREFEARILVDAEAAVACYNSDEQPSPEAYCPTEDNCRFCKGKLHCEALSKHITSSIDCDLIEGEKAVALLSGVREISNARLAQALPNLDTFTKIIKGLWEVAHSRLMAGDLPPDDPLAQSYKLVEGKKGARKWINEEEAEKTLKVMKLKMDEMYKMTVISPTQAEKVMKEKGSTRKWAKLEGMISQSEGSPTIVKISDKRPAINSKLVDAEFFEVEKGGVL